MKTASSALALIAASVSLCLMHAQTPAGARPKAAPKGAVTGRMSLVDRQGKVVSTVAETAQYRTATLSPDGKRAAFERTDPQGDNRDLWLAEIASGKLTRFTSDPGWDAFPLWSPDGKNIVFTSNRGGQFDLYQRPTDGSKPEEPLYKSEVGKGPTSWSSDGKFLLYYTLGPPTHVMVASVRELKPMPVVDMPFTGITPTFSPDGRWIACVSNESGENEITIRSFDGSTFGKPLAITKGGGATPLWGANGNEIIYISADRMATAVALDPRTKAPTGSAKPLFKMPDGVLFWDVSADGTRFLMPVP